MSLRTALHKTTDGHRSATSHERRKLKIVTKLPITGLNDGQDDAFTNVQRIDVMSFGK